MTVSNKVAVTNYTPQLGAGDVDTLLLLHMDNDYNNPNLIIDSSLYADHKDLSILTEDSNGNQTGPYCSLSPEASRFGSSGLKITANSHQGIHYYHPTASRFIITPGYTVTFEMYFRHLANGSAHYANLFYLYNTSGRVFSLAKAPFSNTINYYEGYSGWDVSYSGGWAHVAVVYTPTYRALYVNGEERLNLAWSLPSGIHVTGLYIMATNHTTLPAVDGNLQIDEVRVTKSSSPIYTGNFTPPIAPFSSTAALNAESYIDVSATKNSIVRTVRIPVKKGAFNPVVGTINTNPSAYSLAATADGVVLPSAYTNAKFYFSIKIGENFQDPTIWNFTAIPTNGISGSFSDGVIPNTTIPCKIYTVSSISSSVDSGAITVNASRSGYTSLLSVVTVGKNKGSTYSGVSLNSLYHVFATTETSLYIRLNSNGSVDIKRGAGSYAKEAEWFNPVGGTDGTGFFINMKYTSTTGDVLVPIGDATVNDNTFIELTTSREYYLSNSSPGIHTITLQLGFSSSSLGASVNVAVGTLQLVVP